MMVIEKKSKFLFLDGIRGICAIYIALYHAQLFTGYGLETSDLPLFLRPISYFLSFGHYSISVFIVLSGFCLTIPVVKSNDKKLRGGFFAYIKRRAFRILPPYYCALSLFLLLIAILPILQLKQDTAWDSKIPIDQGSVVSHILLVHNLSEDWFLKIDGPMWSVATEWQIYFIFPLLIILWNRFGIITSSLFATVIGFIPYIILPKSNNFYWAHPWYVGLFASGMMAAVVVFSNNDKVSQIRKFFNWHVLGTISMVLLPIIVVVTKFLYILPLILVETICGYLISIIIMKYTINEIENKPKSIVSQVLCSKFAIAFGTFSYSIYLIHSPILGLINLIFLKVPMGIATRFLFMTTIATSIALSISYLFYYTVERKSMSFAAKKPSPAII
ncbi:acyltransferase [Dyadobacter sp. CY356]|uniref:acyltransferase family protein n=1 Tax=Dyadobacter sp. CY356 TaxID=2906442 RepID=UPI001F2D061B|nr:acyltransferase [Dyadobacter sp. CY356]MCF0055165.1 acyltransferase [Dyadobacter sp. CY356]